MVHDEELTFYKLLEVLVSAIAIVTPMIAVLWYVGGEFHKLETEITGVKQVLLCTVRSLSSNNDPHVCIGEK